MSRAYRMTPQARKSAWLLPLPVAKWTHWGLCPTLDEPIFHGLQPEYKGVGVASLPAPATDAASAALLKLPTWLRGFAVSLRQFEHCRELFNEEVFGLDNWADTVEAALASLPAPAAPDGLRTKLQAFVDRERELLRPRTGQSVGYQPSITPSVLKALEAMLASAPAAPEKPPE